MRERVLPKTVMRLVLRSSNTGSVAVEAQISRIRAWCGSEMKGRA